MKHLICILMVCFTWYSCKKDAQDIQNDLCKGIICNNGGNCVNGDCNCPPQWTGTDCSQQKTPTNIVLKTIIVNKFPANDPSGGSWDIGSGADIYVVIKSGSTVLYTSNYVTNVVGGVTFQPSFTLPDVTGIYSIEIYDHDDFDADDYIGGVQGAIYSSTNNFPNTLEFTCGPCTVGYTIPLGYTW